MTRFIVPFAAVVLLAAFSLPAQAAGTKSHAKTGTHLVVKHAKGNNAKHHAHPKHRKHHRHHKKAAA